MEAISFAIMKVIEAVSKENIGIGKIRSFALKDISSSGSALDETVSKKSSPSITTVSSSSDIDEGSETLATNIVKVYTETYRLYV